MSDASVGIITDMCLLLEMIQSMATQVMVKEGKVKHIGLSECSPADVRRANAVHPIAALEMEWSLFTRDAEVGSQSIKGLSFYA